MNLTAPFAFARYAARVLLPLQRMRSGCTRHRFAWHTLTPAQRQIVHEVLRNHPLALPLGSAAHRSELARGSYAATQARSDTGDRYPRS
jgi:hypothetical protein